MRHKWTRWLQRRFNSDMAPSPFRLKRFKRSNLAKLFGELNVKTGAEIGVLSGRYSELICQSCPGIELLCVDAWTHYDGDARSKLQDVQDEAYRMAQERLEPFNATLVKAFSMDAVQDVPLESLDLVYIDACHQFDFVMQDLIEWSKRVKHGGIVAGHDYYLFQNAGVVTAVNAYTEAHAIREWYLTADRSSSFFWVRP